MDGNITAQYVQRHSSTHPCLQGLYAEYTSVPHDSLVAQVHLAHGGLSRVPQEVLQARPSKERQHGSLNDASGSTENGGYQTASGNWQRPAASKRPPTAHYNKFRGGDCS